LLELFFPDLLFFNPTVDPLQELAIPLDLKRAGAQASSGLRASAESQEDPFLMTRNNIPPVFKIHTGLNDISSVNDIISYAGDTELISRNEAIRIGDEERHFYFCNFTQPITGKDLRQWAPGKAQTLGFSAGVVGTVFLFIFTC